MRIKVSRFSGLESAKESATSAVDEAAEKARSRHISVGAGQAMEYEEAYRQATEFMTNPDRTYSILKADVDAGLAGTIAEASQQILDARRQWESVGTQIRAIRLKAKREIRRADDERTVFRLRDSAVNRLGEM